MIVKQALRRELLALRNTISSRDKQAWDAAINQAITAHDWFLEAKAILAYYPINSEPDIRPALEEALRQGKQLFLPKCNPGTKKMIFHQITSLDDLCPGAHGIPEPQDNCQLSTVNWQLCLVPGVSFDKAGCRLGYGGGYYDRFLARHGNLRTMGVCYGVLLRESLPKNAMDVAVERVVTEGEEHEREPK